MGVGPGTFGPLATAVALLLLAIVVLCLVHLDTLDADDDCASFGPLVGPVALLALLLLGQFLAAPMAAYQVIPADLSPPPPKA